MRHTRPAFIALALVLAASAPNAVAQSASCPFPDPRLTLPVEISQGGATAGPDAQTLYAAGLRVQPTLGFGCARTFIVAPVGALHVIGRQARAMGGISAGARLLRPTALGGVVSAPVFLSGEALFGRERTLVTGALTLDVLRALRITARVGRDVDGSHTVFELGAGTDVSRWMGAKPPVVPPRRASEFADLDSFPRFVAVRMSIWASALREGDCAPQLERARRLADDAERVETIAALQQLVADRQLPCVGTAVAKTLDDAVRRGGPTMNDPVMQRKLVVAIVRGWRVAMREP